MNKKNLILIIIISFLSVHADNEGFCSKDAQTCTEESESFNDKKLLFYDVNPPEGFNLRRDVYMRFAIMLAEAKKRGRKTNWQLILPPWYHLYHWKNERKPAFWGEFFDIDSLKSYAPVAELHEVFTNTKEKVLEIDTLYVLQNFPDAFENGVFEEKWKISEGSACSYNGYYWGYNNVTAKEVICAQFQGKISKLWELITMHLSDKKVMIAHGEIPLHDNYGTKSYWDCRRSMKFHKNLVKIAKQYIKQNLDCETDKCTNYLSVHWRRQDFVHGRGKDIPTITGTAKQIDDIIRKHPKINKVFIASDASEKELQLLENQLNSLGHKVYFYTPSKGDLKRYREGGVAIIDQIICSHAAYFIGTHESTFSFRIQEEREILGFDSSTTFNRLCPDNGKCEKPSKWTIIN